MTDIEADYELPSPAADAGVAAWEAWCDRVTDEEKSDLAFHQWLEGAAASLKCPLPIPPSVARDLRLDSKQRHVLAAVLDLDRVIDVTMPNIASSVTARLFGNGYSESRERTVVPALADLVRLGALGKSARGGVSIQKRQPRDPMTGA